MKELDFDFYSADKDIRSMLSCRDRKMKQDHDITSLIRGDEMLTNIDCYRTSIYNLINIDDII